MPRKRIHELAKEWGMDTRYLLSKLEELGVQGKKAQSTLTDEEIALVRPGLAVPDTSALVLGEEKIVGERLVTELDQQNEQVVTARQEIRESRLTPGLIRRRAKRIEVLHEEEAAAPLSSSSPALEASVLPALDEPFTTSSALPLAFEMPEVESVSTMPVAPFPEPEEGVTTQREASETTAPSFSQKGGELSPIEGSPPPAFAPIAASEASVSREARAPIKEEAPVRIQESRVSPTSTPSVQMRETPRSSQERPAVAQRPPVSSVGVVTATPGRVPVAVSPGVATVPVRQDDPPRSSRVLGRIDLGKLAQEQQRPRPVEVRPIRPPASAPGRPSTTQPAAPATREPSREGGVPVPVGGEAPPAGGVGRRPKKRKVIRSPEQQVEVQERDPRTGRGRARGRT